MPSQEMLPVSFWNAFQAGWNFRSVLAISRQRTSISHFYQPYHSNLLVDLHLFQCCKAMKSIHLANVALDFQSLSIPSNDISSERMPYLICEIVCRFHKPYPDIAWLFNRLLQIRLNAGGGRMIGQFVHYWGKPVLIGCRCRTGRGEFRRYSYG